MNSNVKERKYVGIDNDINGGMTDTGKVIRDAWVFEILPETETCEGWLSTAIQELWDKTSKEWEKYGFLISNLPEDKKQRFQRIQSAAITRAKAEGWDPEKDIENDSP